MQTKPRYANIDLLRSIAISIVVFYHSVNMSKVPQWMWDIGETGSLGVDLFFVLSGFLVGGLYFKERREFGKVNISRFIGRRVFRTLPLYFLIMPLAYFATYSARKVPFDWFYLLFLQNYCYEMPFYVISWSLCVEEHFYLVMPFVLPFLIDKNNQLKWIWWVILFFTPMTLRFLAFNNYGTHTGFGYFVTATHFRFEGLLLGLAISGFGFRISDNISSKSEIRNPKSEINMPPQYLKPFLSYKVVIYALTAASVLACAFVPIFIKSCFAYTWVALMFGASLLALYFSPTISFAQSPVNRQIALSSYSTYLVHSLVIHGCVKVFGMLHISSPFLTIPLMMGACFIAGFMVYSLFEKKLMYWRDKYLPAKKREKLVENVSRHTPQYISGV
jgi:peptidoglycan/LPS O-acetylase OafA/YrhL